MACPNSCRQTEKIQRIVTMKKQTMALPVLFGRHHDIIAFALAHEQVPAEQEVPGRDGPRGLACAHVVEIYPAALNVFSGLALRRAQTRMDEDLKQRHARPGQPA